MTVSDTSLRNASAQDAPYRLPVGENVYLDVLPSGKKVWRMRFINPVNQKPAIYTFGRYPKILLKDVRRLADDAKDLIAEGIHPLAHKREQKLKNIGKKEKTFEFVARQWHEIKRHEWEPKNATKILHGLERDVFPAIGSRQIGKLTAPEILEMLRRIEKRGAFDYTHRTKQRCSLIFSFAIGEGKAERNPVQDIKANLKKYKESNYKYLKAEQLPKYLSDLEQRTGHPVVNLAMKLVLHVFLRTDELRMAKWEEIDFEQRLWKVPADRMKMNNEHWIPLSDQVISLLHELEEHRKGDYLFPIHNKHKPMSSGAMIKLLYDMGYKGKATVHGFRATFSTIANDAEWNADAIEVQLAHKIGGVRGKYNHAVYMDVRTQLMQWYSDYLDNI